MRRSFSVMGTVLTVALALAGPSVPTGPASATAVPAAERSATVNRPELPSHAEARRALAQVKAMAVRHGKNARTRRVQPAEGRSLTLALRDLRLARPALSKGEKREADRLLARPTDLGGDNLGTTSQPYFVRLVSYSSDCTSSAYFCVHHARTSGQAAQARKVAGVMDHVRATLVGRLRYRAPLSDASYTRAGNPDHRFDVYLADIGNGGYYGYCSAEQVGPDRTAPSYCVLDDDFDPAQFGSGKSSDDLLRVTAAHEYFHAIQFAYDVGEDIWLMEGSAVWAEERVYDGVNDYLQYVRSDSAITQPGIPVDQDSVHNLRFYSAMLFFEHLTQTLGIARMREVWQATVGAPYSLQAIRSVVSRHTSWRGFINRFGVWNSRPPGVGYSERRHYPAGSYVANRKLGIRAKRSASVSLRRDHLASAAVRLVPARKSTRKQRIRININGPSRARGAVAAVQRRLPNGRTRWNHVRLNRYGNARIVQPFGRGRISSVVVTVANASTVMRNCGSSAPVIYSCGGYGAYNDAWRVSARVIG